MARYAKGKFAVGRCGRCGDKVPYKDLRADGQYPGMRVCDNCRDEKHPTEKQIRLDEGIALRNPAPDVDDDSAGNTDNLADTLFPDDNVFGGT